MHEASFAKMKAFLEVYGGEFPTGSGKSRVLEVGSKSYAGQTTYRDLIDDSKQIYTGLDLESGPNVDVVTSGAYIWPELGDESFDVCISGQTFEHNPFFWVTICEIARVLTPGGYACVIAPGAGAVHRYPVDCWRFYPDSWAALCALAALELVESYFEIDSVACQISGGEWRDSMMIARKPLRTARDAVERRAHLTAPFREGFGQFEPVSHRVGPAIRSYAKALENKPSQGLMRKLQRRRRQRRIIAIHDPGLQ